MTYISSWTACIKDPTTPFNFSQYVCFTTSFTRTSAHHKLKDTLSRTNFTRHFYFNRLPRLWNSLPPLHLSQSLPTIMHKLKKIYGVISLRISILPMPVLSITCAPVVIAQPYLSLINTTLIVECLQLSPSVQHLPLYFHLTLHCIWHLLYCKAIIIIIIIINSLIFKSRTDTRSVSRSGL